MLRLINWDGLFENATTRKLKHLPYVLFRNTFDDYQLLIRGQNGTARFACWVAMTMIASQGDVDQRGYLRDASGQPHTAQTLSWVTGLPEADYQDAISYLLARGWLDKVAEDPAIDAPKDDRTWLS